MMQTISKGGLDWLDCTDRVEELEIYADNVGLMKESHFEQVPRRGLHYYVAPNGEIVAEVNTAGGKVTTALVLEHFHRYYDHFLETPLEGILRQGFANIDFAVQNVIIENMQKWDWERKKFNPPPELDNVNWRFQLKHRSNEEIISYLINNDPTDGFPLAEPLVFSRRELEHYINEIRKSDRWHMFGLYKIQLMG